MLPTNLLFIYAEKAKVELITPILKLSISSSVAQYIAKIIDTIDHMVNFFCSIIQFSFYIIFSSIKFHFDVNLLNHL